MKKHEFLARLREGLAGLSHEDIEERAAFYSEMIDDRVEEGLSEEEAVLEIGNADEIAARIIADASRPTGISASDKPKRKLKAWEIVLLAVGSPVWLSLLIAAVAVVFSLYISLWACVISLWAVDLALAVCMLGCVLIGVTMTAHGYIINGLLMFGAALLCAGLAVFLFFGSLAATKGAVWLVKWLCRKIRSLFTKKEVRA